MAGLTQTALLKFMGDSKGATAAINSVGSGLKALQSKTQGATGLLGSAGAKVTRTFGSLQGVLKKTQLAIGGVANSVRLFSQGITNVGRAVMFFIGMPLAAFMGAGFKAAISFEDALVRVKKTTNLTSAEMVTLTQKIRDIAKETVSSHTELAIMAEQLGQLGVKSGQAIPQYVRLFDMIATATDVGGDEVVKSVGRIATAFGWSLDTSFDSVYRLSNVINVLENNTAASASEIIKALENSAQAASLLGISSYEIAALDAALISAGLSADEAGTAMRNMILKMTQNADKVADMMSGTEKYATAQSVLTAINEDATLVILDLVAAMSAEDDRALALATSFDVVGIRGGKAFAGLGVNQDNMLKSLKLASLEWERATSLMYEYEQALLSTQSQLKVLKNNVTDAGITLANSFLPVINRIIQYAIPAIQELAAAFDTLPFKTKAIAIGIVLLTIALGPLLFFFGQLSHGFTLMILGAQALLGTISSLIGVVGSLVAGLITLNPATILAVAALTVGAGAIMKVLQGMGVNIAGFFSDLADRALAWGENLATTYGQGLIVGAANAIARALAWIANLISSFLEGHSPPDQGPLAHIDKWGKTLIDTFLMSFKNADFSVLRSIGRTIQNIFASFAVIGKIGEGQEFVFAAKARTQLAKLISIFNETGEVAEDVLSKIVSKLGEAADEVEELIRRQLEYNGLLKQLDELAAKRSDAIAAYKEEIALITQSTMSAEQKAEAIRKAKLERDKELGAISKEQKAAEDQIDAAKERVDWQKALIDAMQDQDALQKRMLATMERMAKAASAAAAAGGGGGAGAGDGAGFELPDVEELKEEFEKALEPIRTLRERIDTARDGWDIFIGAVKGESLAEILGPHGMQEFFALDGSQQNEYLTLFSTGQKIYDVWSGISGFIEGIGTSLEGFDISGVVGDIDIKQMLVDIGFAESFIEYISTELETVKTWISGQFTSIFPEGFGEGMGDIGEGIGESFGPIKDWFTTNWPVIQGVIMTAWEVIKGVFSSVAAVLGPPLADLGESFGKLFESIGGSDAVVRLLLFLGKALGYFAGFLGGVILLALALFTGALEAAILVITDIVDWFTQMIESGKKVKKGIDDVSSGIKKIFSGDWLGGAEDAQKGFDTIGEAFKEMALNTFGTILDIIKDTIGGFLGGVFEFVANLLGELTGDTTVVDAFRGWFDPLMDLDMSEIFLAWFAGLKDSMESGWIASVRVWFDEKILEFEENWNKFGPAVTAGLAALGVIITESLTTAWESVVTWIGEKVLEWTAFWVGLPTQAYDGLATLWETVSQAFLDFWLSLAAWFGAAYIGILAAFGTFVLKAYEGLKDLWLKVKERFTEITTGLKERGDGSVIGGILKAVADVGEDIMTSLKEALVEFGQAALKYVIGLVNLIAGKIAGIMGSISKATSALGGVGTTQGEGTTKEGAAALGAFANAGDPFIVGEVGPELFIPNTHGMIIPSNKTMDALGGSGISLVMNIHDPVIRDDQDIDRLAEEVMDRLGETLGDAMRYGGARF